MLRVKPDPAVQYATNAEVPADLGGAEARKRIAAALAARIEEYVETSPGDKEVPRDRVSVALY